MKKVISLLLCFMIAMSIVGCGKKNEEPNGSTKTTQSGKSTKGDKAETAETIDVGEYDEEGEVVEGNDVEEDGEPVEESEEGQEDVSSEDGETTAETKVLQPESASELESMVDEFNTTEDPERKEELRKELEEFLKQAEEAAPAN